MNNKDLNTIKNITVNHQITPNPEAWNRVHRKIKDRKTKSRIINYRNISIAAVLVSVLSITFLFEHMIRDHNPGIFASNETYTPMVIEDLETTTEGNSIYTVENIRRLHNAYRDAGL